MRRHEPRSQSPSLRGSGRFCTACAWRPSPARVSIPFIAGQWSLLCRLVGVGGERRLVSIPFIAGQWSLLDAFIKGWGTHFIVSIPFIAGQWSLPAPGRGDGRTAGRFQSPSLRGSGRFTSSLSATADSTSGFNPLHCGAVVASMNLPFSIPEVSPVSIPFIAGQWSLQDDDAAPDLHAAMFQSPSLRGSGRFLGFVCGVPFLAPGVSIPFIAGQWSLRRPFVFR